MDVARVYDIVEKSDGVMNVFAGERITESFLLGAVGYVNPFGNYVPRPSIRIFELLEAGDRLEDRADARQVGQGLRDPGLLLDQHAAARQRGQRLLVLHRGDRCLVCGPDHDGGAPADDGEHAALRSGEALRRGCRHPTSCATASVSAS